MKSQISIFVIIGLVIVIITAIVVYKINEKRINDLVVIEEENKIIKPVLLHVQECLKKVSMNAMVKLGDQGLIEPKAYISSDDIIISYFYYKGQVFMPNIDLIENDVTNYISSNIAECVTDFSKTGYALDYSDSIYAAVEFQPGIVNISLDYPITVYTDGQEFNINEFKINIRLNFQDIYKLSREIIQDTEKNPEWINFDFFENTPFEVRLIKVDENTLIYEILDNAGINNMPYRYRFAVKYDF